MLLTFAVWMSTALLIYGLVLAVHAFRTQLSLAPTYITLGFITCLMMWASILGARLPMGPIVIFWGSTLFSGLLIGIFAIYVFDGSAAARMAMLTVCVLILGTYAAQRILDVQLASGLSVSVVQLPPVEIRGYLASAFAAFCDLLFLAFVWESLHRFKPTRILLVRVFLTLSGTLFLDTVLYLGLAYGDAAIFKAYVLGSLADRFIVSVWVAPILTAYVAWQRRVHGVDLGRGRVFAILQRSAKSERELVAAQREIALRTAVEEALREKEEQFRTLVTNIPGVTFRCLYDENRTMLFISESIREATGYDPEDFVQNRIRTFASLVHPDDLEMVRKTIDQANTDRAAYSIGYRIVGKSGSVHWMGERGRIAYDDEGQPKWIDGVVSDVTERRVAEDALRQSREYSARFEFIANAVEDNMSFLDREFRLLAVNEAWLRAMNASRETVIGKTLAEVWGGGAFDREIRDVMEPCFEGRTVVYRRWIDFPGLGRRFCEVKMFPYRNESDVVSHIVAVTRDITQEHEAEQEITEARNAAEAANRAKSEFLATMSHEIRTPMNAIIGMTRLALKTELSPKQQDYLSKTLASANSLLGIINDILDFSKIEAGRLEMESVVFNLDDVLNHLANLISVKAAEKDHVEVLFDTPVDVPRMLVGDPLRLGQVLLNLASNAVKFTDAGEIVIKTRLIELVEKGCVLRFSITDSGIGMTDEQMARLFQPFTQADGSTTRRYGGTGLGLTISKRLVELMRGTISVTSTPGAGSTFSFTARFDDPDESTPIYRSGAPDLRGMRVLVVDDNARSREVLENMLQSMSFQVQSVDSGQKAITCLTKGLGGDPFDLVLMDWQMPEMNGIDAAKAIRDSDRITSKPGIILVTAYGKDEAVREAEQAGIGAVLAKPVSESALFDTVMYIAGLSGRPSDQALTAANESATAGLDGLRVLLVEDNEINQQVAEELLQGAGVSVTIASNGQEAVTMVQSADYDVVLMDIQMPVLDGYAATKSIRSLPAFKTLPIIAMTANAMAGDRERCLAAGMNAHVAKPIDPDELFATLHQWAPSGRADTASQRAPKPAQQDIGTEADWPAGDLDGIAVSEGIARVGGNRKLYVKLLRQFRDRNASSADEIAEALRAGDRELAARIAHSMKGSAGNIGASAVYKVAAVLESAIKSGTSINDLETELADFRKYLQIVVHSVGLLDKVETHPKQTANGGNGDFDPAKGLGLIHEAGRMLVEDYSVAMERVEDLKSLLHGTPLQDRLHDVERAFENFDTDRAAQVLQELAEAIQAVQKEK
ncbi:MAG: hypothetical protein AMXMBFR84_46430 [Candidatus Hydrogenedentota bacterium]